MSARRHVLTVRCDDQLAERIAAVAAAEPVTSRGAVMRDALLAGLDVVRERKRSARRRRSAA